jgi:hypothetical protein
MLKRTPVMLVMLCALASSSCATVRSTCLPMREYPAEKQQVIASQLATVPVELKQLVQDYFVMREANRACRKGH